MSFFGKICKRRCNNKSVSNDDFPWEAMIEILGFKPKNPEFYKLSLIARSALEKDSNGKRIDNERLEYLGDAILGAIVSDLIYEHFPEMKEGFMTVLRSQMVKREMLNNMGDRIGLSQFVHGLKGKNNRNIYGNAVEALVGAVYLDQGYDVCKTFVRTRLYNSISMDKLAEREENHKSQLMEWGQKNRKAVTYEVFSEEPQPPQTTQFFAKVYIDGVEYGSGIGSAKRKAEQAASKQALRLIALGK